MCGFASTPMSAMPHSVCSLPCLTVWCAADKTIKFWTWTVTTEQQPAAGAEEDPTHHPAKKHKKKHQQEAAAAEEPGNRYTAAGAAAGHGLAFKVRACSSRGGIAHLS